MPDEVVEVFRAAFQLDDGFQLQGSMSFDDVPGWDSVGHMNLVTELESRFDISLDMDEIVGLDSVNAVQELVATRKNR
ncbi:MAG: acyl carrier protein [Planctomycetota bacterium]|jgi:acyl carrier protein